ncbi:MAG: DEAD/DEAH box helicase [Fibrobacter intestinalis]|uniref:DEAD/DEAH box helicase n=1 Tax=Fibrobacter TaxID=832 RepID=UPI000BB159C1|nr:DUF3516 domain-containing protein [Fibrobacter sp. UWS1]PBC68825.1 helicase-like protein [Fibrobacter sp. UWS1]
MAKNLQYYLPQKDEHLSSEDLLGRFLTWTEEAGIHLYEAQENAILELFDGKNVILNTPTGSGKSLVAEALHFISLACGRRSAYTCPIKALVNEKWMALCKEFGPENVGLSTGDATVNMGAPILCCTAEILENRALGEGELLDIQDVVMDEFHYYSDRERGVAWQVPLLTLPQTRFLLMSATIGKTDFFEQAISRLNGKPCVTVTGKTRPVPLDFSYSMNEISTTVQGLVNSGKAPVYIVHFTQASAAENAQNLTSLNLCSKEEKAAIAKEIDHFRFSSPYGPEFKRFLKVGIGLHHAGLLPKYRILVEKLSQKGLLKVICGTDTLGVGVNVPIRTVLFTQLCKYSGDKTAILAARDFHQIAGRAGRKGFDDIGFVVAQAPAHVIENAKLAAKSSQTGKKFVKRKPPERGFVPWDESIYRRLIESPPEPLTSRFEVSHGMLINVLSRKTDGCSAMRKLIRDCHETAKRKKELMHRAFQLFRSLVEKNIVEFLPNPQQGMAHVQVNLDLQNDFAMNEPLSLYLLDTLPQLSPESPDFALDVVSLVESIVENPESILRVQLKKARDARYAELKAEHAEYNKIQEELDKVEYPKPLRDFIYTTFNAFAEEHPWVGDLNVEPKSIVREMIENFDTFSGYVKKYGLARMEALLLRHINYVYKVLAQTVPDSFKTEEILEIQNYLDELIRRTDSSLLEEWERLKNPEFIAEEMKEEKAFRADEASKDVTLDKKKFVANARARIFAFLSQLRNRNIDGALELLSEDLSEGQVVADGENIPWTENRLEELLLEFHSEHGNFRLDAEGRSVKHSIVVWTPSALKIQQILQDEEDVNDWEADFSIPLEESREAGMPLIRLDRIGSIA